VPEHGGGHLDFMIDRIPVGPQFVPAQLGPSMPAW
jgi:hypothetical protein